MVKTLVACVLVLAFAAPAAADPEPPFVMRRPQPLWQPLSLLGGGVALAGIGALFQLRANSLYDDYNDAIASECAEGGCAPDEIPQSIRDLRTSGDRSHAIGLTSMILGGVGVVGGLVWLMIDYPRPVRLDVAPDRVGVVAEVEF